MFRNVVGVKVGVVRVGAPGPAADLVDEKSSLKLSPDIGRTRLTKNETCILPVCFKCRND